MRYCKLYDLRLEKMIESYFLNDFLFFYDKVWTLTYLHITFILIKKFLGRARKELLLSNVAPCDIS
jgi:hypothetical protein